MTIFTTLNTSGEFIVVGDLSTDAEAENDTETDSEPVTVASVSSTISTSSETDPTETPQSNNTRFMVPAETIEEGSSDSNEVLFTMMLEESSEQPISGDSEPERLSLVNQVSDAERLGVELGLGGDESDSLFEGTNILEERGTAGELTELITVAPTSPNVADGEFSFPESDDGRSESLRNRQRFEDGAEKIIGRAPTPEEKPRILATMASGFSSGFPSKNILFIKKFVSDRGLVESYSIERKTLFERNSFEEIGRLETDNLPISPKYNSIISILPQPQKNIFIFEDINVSPNSVYIYRIVCRWSLLTQEERRQKRFEQATIDALSQRASERNIFFTIL